MRPDAILTRLRDRRLRIGLAVLLRPVPRLNSASISRPFKFGPYCFSKDACQFNLVGRMGNAVGGNNFDSPCLRQTLCDFGSIKRVGHNDPHAGRAGSLQPANGGSQSSAR